jgi:neutral ceramidase
MRAASRIWWMFSLVGVALAVGCARTPQVRQPDTAVLSVPALAGVGTADITPPPGFPTGGHGPAGAMSRGHWTRLLVRAFYFRDTTGRGFMLITVDTFAVSRRLHQDVAKVLARAHRDRNEQFGPESLVLAATHTHQGPGNYLSAALYNTFGSAVLGHHARLEAHLREGLLAAGRTAMEDARNNPGRHVRLLRGSLSDRLQLNRSPRVFMLNHDRDTLLKILDDRSADPVVCPPQAPPGEPEADWDIKGCPRLRAINRRVSLLQILDANNAVVGMAVFLALHPTALAADAPFFSADLFGVAGRDLEARLLMGQTPPVVGFFNGAEGDVVPRRTRRDLGDARGLGQRLGHEILGIASRAHEPATIDLTRIEARLSLERWDDHPEKATPRLASRPMPGPATLGGSEGDRTSMYDRGYRDGVRRTSRGEQGVKQPALDLPGFPAIFTSIIAPRLAYPQRLPVTVVRMGSVAMVTVPFEASTAVGLHLESALAAVQLDAPDILVIGLANEYASYMATADEYEAQDYMGSSTMWGPEQAAYVEQVVQKLGTASGSSTVGASPAFFPGLPAHLGPTKAGDHRLVPDATLERVVQTKDGLPARDLPQFVWGEPYDDVKTSLEVTARRRVEVLREGGEAVDVDTGYQLLTLQQEAPENGRATWSAIWLRPLWEAVSGRFYFKVSSPGAAPQCSAHFDAGTEDRLVLQVVACP